MSVTTSQNAFTPMKGHVADNATVNMNNGDVLKIRSSSSNGFIWNIINSDIGEVLYKASSAFEVEFYIVNY